MARRRSINEIVPDLNRELNSAWNGFIKQVSTDLATDRNKGGVSPAYTGFFASSWKASLTPNAPTDRVQDYPTWYKIKKQRDKKLPAQPKIKPRFTVGTFKITDTVYIGNKVEYAIYALESPDISSYVQGQLRGLIRNTFRERQTVIVGFKDIRYTQGGAL